MSGEQITIAGLLIAALVGGATGQWVFGWVYRAMERDRDYWRKRALGLLGLADIAVSEVAKKANDDV